MTRYVCIHGHFYQPPRENPWLEMVERQPSASPFHDWNERITVECYRPNATARILDEQNRIRRIVDNYARMSFNVGPSLLGWLERHAADVYAAMLEADETSRRRFSGHGSALAQAYNHLIMPLADDRDRRTQVRWGIRDFESRFGRGPEGMWLPETAVDLASLEALAAEGIRFTILAPHQARRVRPLAGGPWRTVDERGLDTGRAYLQRLPSGRSIALFFYHGALARGVAFEGLLESGSAFADRLLELSRHGEGEEASLAHLATDGETYGHHHRFGEMALAAALARVEAAADVRLTNYGEFLELHPPTMEVEIAEDTSWSCVHGIERWRSDCGCHSGGEPNWSQAWRVPLRQALDGLRDGLRPAFEAAARELLEDPWEARDAYVDVVLDRSDESVAAFVERHGAGRSSEDERVRILRLMELQRHLQLMYTSCGWFFNDVAGIETLQVLGYAARALELADGALGNVEKVRERFLEVLGRARSNRPEAGSAADLWRHDVLPRSADLEDAVVHRVVRGLLEAPPPDGRFYAWRIETSQERRVRSGTLDMALGRARVRSVVTREASDLRWGALRIGELSITAGVAPVEEGNEPALATELVEDVERGDAGSALRRLESSYGRASRSLRTLWPEERRWALQRIAGQALEATADAARLLYERRAPLLRALAESGQPVPALWEAAAASTLQEAIEALLAAPRPDVERLGELLERGRTSGVRLEESRVRSAGRAALEAASDRFAGAPLESGRLESLARTLEAVRALPFEVGVRGAQDCWWAVSRSVSKGEIRPEATWRREFGELGRKLGFREQDEGDV